MTLRGREYGVPRDDAPAWVVLHGWGFDGSVMEPLARSLAAEHHVYVVDLPGFGPDDTGTCGGDVHAMADALAAEWPGPAHWLGWSLGGLVALDIAYRHPACVTGLDLLAASPRFVADDGWPGIAAGQLERFMDELGADPAAAHRRFLGFQLAGSDGARGVLRRLRAHSDSRGLPPGPALAGGLQILRRADLRQALPALSCPVRATLGGADPLVPPALAEPLAAAGVVAQLVEGAGHAPFLSHPGAVLEALRQPMP